MAEARTGQDIAKKRPLTWRGEGNASGGMALGETQEDATGRNPEKKASPCGTLTHSDRSG